jgi:hypothetical protein
MRKLIGGAALVGEGAALAFYGGRYIDFMERHNLMGFGKRVLRRLGVRSKSVLVPIGMAEAAIGLIILARLRSHQRALA